jgi:ABC-2 type transport system permease protein
MVNGFRYGLLGVSDVGLGVAFGIMALFAALLYGAAYYLLKQGIGLRS